ncbi:ABC transporter ATP-binding protein [Massilia sp. Mn16-1_5]|uniref:ABC transporter ATP-binding protein n=1 Tax=Massilia sp. Mn16-1_5 TaxID=2079199 RepID=UPI00109E45C7|nr:ABC transporter ATP-binding protein [Massilia sp. Mn16-1_5]THC45225.1 ABC transporter ATP-binding protein [Massilia sp. Mn16-1_5]
MNTTPLMQATGLTRRFGGLVAVDGVSIDLHRGQVHAVIGTNGAGKSTLINLLSGEIPLSSGEIRLAGRDITGLSQPRRARSGVGRSYQRTTIFPTLPVLENCRLAAQAAQQRPWTLWEGAQSCRASLEAARAALDAAGLADAQHLPAGSMSHGKKRQLEIAMCLATAPQVLLLDEPLAGMGFEESERMLSMLERLRLDHAILLVEHDMDAVFRVADCITVMVNGAVIASGSPESVRSSPEVQRAYLGEGHA